jgi:hypothetical protein
MDVVSSVPDEPTRVTIGESLFGSAYSSYALKMIKLGLKKWKFYLQRTMVSASFISLEDEADLQISADIISGP